MPTSPPPPDHFQREIEDIVRLAERRLERESLAGRIRRAQRRWSRRNPIVALHVPSSETLGGTALALLLASWLLSLVHVGFFALLAYLAQIVGIALLISAIVVALVRRGPSGESKIWRGEHLSYGSPYSGSTLLGRLRRFFRAR